MELFLLLRSFEHTHFYFLFILLVFIPLPKNHNQMKEQRRKVYTVTFMKECFRILLVIKFYLSNSFLSYYFEQAHDNHFTDSIYLYVTLEKPPFDEKTDN